MRNFIVTNKSVILRNIENSIPCHQVWKWKGVDVIGMKQLCALITFEAEQRIREKYLSQEVKEILKEVSLKKPLPSEIKKIFKFVEFEELRTQPGGGAND